jgi:hypothetical protein
MGKGESMVQANQRRKEHEGEPYGLLPLHHLAARNRRICIGQDRNSAKECAGRLKMRKKEQHEKDEKDGKERMEVGTWGNGK